MPKTPSIKLFDLIQSLSGSEKRYFKVFATKNQAANVKYLQLFEIIDKQTTYDETAIKSAIYATTTFETRKFSELKNYLYKLILKSLQTYDEKTSVDFKLKNMLANVRVLAKRSFYEDAKFILAKARKIAKQYEMFLVILEIIAWEKRIAYAESNISFLDENLEELNNSEQESIQKLQKELEYWNIYFSLLMNSKKEATLRSEEKKQWLNHFFDNELLIQNLVLPTFQSNILYHRSYGYYYFSIGDYQRFYNQNNILIRLMESHKRRLREDPSHYISVINNQIFACGMLRKYDEVDYNLEKLKAVKAQTVDDDFKIFTQYYLNKLVLCVESGNFEQGKTIIKAREKEIVQYKKLIFKENFYLLYAYVYFGLRDFNQSLVWINELLNMPKTIVRKDLQSVARIIYLIVHYEIGNSILLESLLRSTYRYLRKQDRFYGFESVILKFIRKSKDLITRKQLNEAYVDLKASFITLSEEPSEKAIFRYFNFMAWIDSKINGSEFSKEVRTQFREGND
ncbi:MAG: hypothetical protein AB8G11_12365 [Saprospiraceae bacterium]